MIRDFTLFLPKKFMAVAMGKQIHFQVQTTPKANLSNGAIWSRWENKLIFKFKRSLKKVHEFLVIWDSGLFLAEIFYERPLRP
ncbi:hypothetical protein H5410_035146 [Solanum commersonii]|uniref:Uncharacterized protein n=1 Tax=Solanum commersonii TaxID=4109 RepID=A0A9J5Y1T3_SOLCO|nr:hypothetical protein H5410_035146 [Solanum commersonii]